LRSFVVFRPFGSDISVYDKLLKLRVFDMAQWDLVGMDLIDPQY
jgi:hypothetical protein